MNNKALITIDGIVTLITIISLIFGFILSLIFKSLDYFLAGFVSMMGTSIIIIMINEVIRE